MRSKNNTFVLNKRFPTYLSPRLKPVYHNEIVKAMVEQCGGSLFYNDGIPVGIDIEIITLVRRMNANEKQNQKNHTSFPEVSSVLKEVVEALKGAAYVSKSQVAEVFISKIHGNEDRIKITVYRL
jgi:Holliday junction resolvase RusA-like endonuclease